MAGVERGAACEASTSAVGVSDSEELLVSGVVG